MKVTSENTVIIEAARIRSIRRLDEKTDSCSQVRTGRGQSRRKRVGGRRNESSEIMGDAAAGLVFWICLYLIPLGLLRKNWESRVAILRRAARIASTWGLAYCLAASLVCGAMSGTVGLIGGGIGSLLWMMWASLTYAATRHR